MGAQTLTDKIMMFIAGIGWKLFLWGSGTNQEEYWKLIYEQEKDFRENPEKYNVPEEVR